MRLGFAQPFHGGALSQGPNHHRFQFKHPAPVYRGAGPTARSFQSPVITCDINQFQPELQFDRLVSVEMFEHVRNHRQLFSQIATWLKPGAKVFIHIFAHHTHAFLYEAEHADEWMARHFFSGGIMPAADLLPLAAADSFDEEQRWNVNGRHYQKTLDAWLALHDSKRDTVMETLRPCYGSETNRWFHRWRLFYLACSELFGYNKGEEWSVMHYRFALKPKA